ncbi:MAG TPA: Uma2 family endonuclease [Gammaproteobacteria bacterium]|nr:Uma2 family endonuclease [Gammaproteobacteria bacterium]
MAVPRPHIRFANEDYQPLPESMDKRYELLSGDPLTVPVPAVEHQRASRKLEMRLVAFVEKHRLGEVFHAPLDVVLGQDGGRDVVHPDVLFISDACRHIVTPKEIPGAPGLVVEILSPDTEERDRKYKKALYGRHQVQEFWLVDPPAKAIEIYRLTRTGWKTVGVFNGAQAVHSPLWPELSLRPEMIF